MPELDEREKIATYLLHFTEPVRKCSHYVGSTPRRLLETRLRRHCYGQGANLTAAVVAKSVGIVLARVWITDDRAFEKKLKKLSHFSVHCPVCNPKLMDKGIEPVKRLYVPHRCNADFLRIVWPQSSRSQ